jgi:hypothetical protein
MRRSNHSAKFIPDRLDRSVVVLRFISCVSVVRGSVPKNLSQEKSRPTVLSGGERSLSYVYFLEYLAV